MTSNAVNWWVVGKGALGSVVAAKLVAANQQVLIKLREHSSAPERHFTFIDATEKPLRSSPVNVPVVNQHSSAPDVIVAAIKAYDVAAFVETYRNAAWGLQAVNPPELIFSYNGMLEDEDLLLKQLPVRHLVTTQAAF